MFSNFVIKGKFLSFVMPTILAQYENYGPGGGMMGFGYGPFGALGMLSMFVGLIFWVLVIVAIVYLIRYFLRDGKHFLENRSSGALEILRERYAKGEIDREEFEKMKKRTRKSMIYLFQIFTDGGTRDFVSFQSLAFLALALFVFGIIIFAIIKLIKVKDKIFFGADLADYEIDRNHQGDKALEQLRKRYYQGLMSKEEYEKKKEKT